MLLLVRIRSAHLELIRETRISSISCLRIQRYFYAVSDYAGQVEQSKGYWNPKENW